MSSKKLKAIKKERPKITNSMVMDVFEENFHEEIERLSLRLEKYNFIAMVHKFLIRRILSFQELFSNQGIIQENNTTVQ